MSTCVFLIIWKESWNLNFDEYLCIFNHLKGIFLVSSHINRSYLRLKCCKIFALFESWLDKLFFHFFYYFLLKNAFLICKNGHFIWKCYKFDFFLLNVTFWTSHKKKKKVKEFCAKLGIELTISRLQVWCSINWAIGASKWNDSI